MKMRNIFAAAVATSIALTFNIKALAQEYVPTDENSRVEFKIENHMMGSSTVTGTFTGLQGKIIFDPNKAASSSFDVSVNVNSIHTGIGMRDKDLKKEKFFDADKYGTMHFRSTKVTGGGGKYVAYGTLTIKGTSKSIEIPFTATQTKGGYMFKGSFKLNRMNFGVSGDPKAISQEPTINLQVFAKKK